MPAGGRNNIQPASDISTHQCRIQIRRRERRHSNEVANHANRQPLRDQLRLPRTQTMPNQSKAQRRGRRNEVIHFSSLAPRENLSAILSGVLI